MWAGGTGGGGKDDEGCGQEIHDDPGDAAGAPDVAAVGALHVIWVIGQKYIFTLTAVCLHL